MTHFFINNLFWCLHLQTNSDFLFNNLSFPANMYGNLKNENKIPFINWRTLKKVYGKPRFIYCKLCLMEKLFINNSTGDEGLLNKKMRICK